MAAYRGVVQPESEDKRIISAEWAKDEDIARFLKALPNWQVVQEPSAEIAESPQEIDLRNTKETAMLKRNLGGFSEIPVHNLLYDANQLRSLAQLQESLEWFSKSLLSLVTGLKASNAARFGMAHLPKLSENSIQTLTSRALEFEELSDTCLLVLHLEVRVHCFHYLHSIWKGPAGAQFFGGHESTEPNMQVCEKNLLDIRFSKPCQKIGFSKANYMPIWSSILPKTKRWDNFQYIKFSQRSFFGRIKDTINYFRNLLTFTYSVEQIIKIG